MPPCKEKHMLLSEIKAGEYAFIEIFNPLGIPLDLSNYYLTDASQEDIKAYYYENKPLGGFIFQFPGGTINPGGYKVVALDDPKNIRDKFGSNVDYDVGDVPKPSPALSLTDQAIDFIKAPAEDYPDISYKPNSTRCEQMIAAICAMLLCKANREQK